MKFCLGQVDLDLGQVGRVTPEQVVTAAEAFFTFLSGSPPEQPEVIAKGDGYIVRWNGLDLVPDKKGK